MDNGAVAAVGSEVVSEESTFTSAEQLDPQSAVRDQSQKNWCMETNECRLEREHPETSSNDVGVDILNQPSAGSDFLAQPSSATVAACELVSDVLNSDSHLAEHDIGRKEMQNHSSENVSFVSQESGDACSYGKRVLESTESCQPTSKRLKSSHDFEVTDLVTTGIQPGLSDEAVAENPDVSVKVAEVENADQSVRMGEVPCSGEEPHSSIVDINLSTTDIQVDDSNKPQEPLSSVVDIKPSTGDIQADDFNKPQETRSSINPSTSDIQADDFNKPQGPLSSVFDVHADVCHKPQEPLSSVVDINPSTSYIQADDSNNKPQELSSVDIVEGNTDGRQQIAMTTSEEPLSQPNKECVGNPNVPDNSSAIHASSDPSVETLTASQTGDQVTESISESLAHAEGTSKSQQKQPRDTPLGVVLPESGIRNEDPEFSETGVMGGEKCLSPFEISMVIDNLIRRELETSESSAEEDMSDDDDDLGDEGDSQLGEKMEEDDEDSGADSESSLRVKDKGESSVEKESDDQNPVSCEVLAQEKDEMTKTVTDCKRSESAADELQSVSNLDQTSLNIDSDKDRVSNETCDKPVDSVTKEPDVEREKTKDGVKEPDVEREKTKDGVTEPDLEREKTKDGVTEPDLEREKTDGVKEPDVECEKTKDGVKEPDVECEKTKDGVKEPDLEREKTDGVKEPDVECEKTNDGVKQLGVEPEQSELLHSGQKSTDEATPVKGSGLVGSVESGSGADLVSEVSGILTQESSVKEDLPQKSTDGSTTKSSELLAGGDAERSIVPQRVTETAPECAGESLVANVSASATGEVAKKMYDPFEDMDIVDEDGATDEDGFTWSDEMSDRTNSNRFSSERGGRRARDWSGQSSRPRRNEHNQRHDQLGPDREDQSNWTRDDQWPMDEQAQWPVDEQASWYNQSNDGEMYSDSRTQAGMQPLMRHGGNYRPSNYDPSSSGNMPSYGMPPPNNAPPSAAPWPAPGCVPPPGCMPPYPGTMPPPTGYSAPMPYGGMTMPQYFGQWGQWPTAGPAYPMVQQQQPQQQQQGQSYQDWQNWWQNYSSWYSSYMSGWNQPAYQPMDSSHYQSQGSWSSANQQYAPPPPTPPTPEAPAPPPPQLPSAKQSPKNIPYVAKTDVASSNPKVSYRPTVTKGPILNSTMSSFTPSSAPKLRFSIPGPASAVATKSTKPSESLSAGKDAAAGEKNDQETGNNIWVGNLPLGTSAVDVRTLISKHGKVVKCKVGSMKTQKDAGLAALVTMETADDVAVCIQMLHEAYYNGQKILVRKLKQQ